MRRLIIIAHNVRSAHNVGSLLRTAEGLGIHKVWLTGYTPYPLSDTEERLPHLARKADRQIAKTALGAEQLVKWEHCQDIRQVLRGLHDDCYVLAALEQADKAVSLRRFQPPPRLALIVGREVQGLEPDVLAASDIILEIPMFGSKESFNVTQAAAMALYHCRFAP